MEIILASGSYKRKEIMEKSGIAFRVEVPEIDERAFENLPVRERVQKIAQAKAIKIAEKFPQDLIIAADTMDEDKFGRIHRKPKNLNQALNLAMNYSGNSVTAYTAVCLIHPEHGEVIRLAETKIKFQSFTKDELRRVVDENFLKRAGALGVTEEAAGFTFVQSISGSYTALAGLPMETVRKYLKKWKVI